MQVQSFFNFPWPDIRLHLPNVCLGELQGWAVGLRTRLGPRNQTRSSPAWFWRTGINDNV